MLDRVDAPAFLVEERVLEHARDREVGVLDRIALQVLVAAVAVEEVAQVGMPLAQRVQEEQRSRRALDVERVVVLDRADRRGEIEVGRRRDDALPLTAQAESGDRALRLRRVGAAAEIERVGEEARRVAAEILERAASEQEDRRAVDAAGEREGDARIGRDRG